MNLKTVRDAYDTYSGKASEITRQLGFAGIAVVWIFRYQVADGLALPDQLRLPLALLVVALAADFLHYVVSAAVWGIFGRITEKKLVKRDDDFETPSKINWPGLFFFWMKIRGHLRLILTLDGVPLWGAVRLTPGLGFTALSGAARRLKL